MSDVEKQENGHSQATPVPPDDVRERETESPKPEDSQIARLTSELEAARRRIDELARAYQALDRDREEFKQRLSRERERMLDVEKGHVASGILEAIDELDRCVNGSAEQDSPLAQGVRLIRNGLLSKIQAMGIERVDLLNRPYDPNLAEATDIEITARPEDDQKVVAEIRGAYRLKERLIRPGRVKVAKYVKPADA